MDPQKLPSDHDLAALPDLDEKILLEQLFQHYRRDYIYTYIGDILISINPYKLIKFYGEEFGSVYTDIQALPNLKPHVYALACRAYQNVQRHQGNQCILVSGESGAGKTEVTKMLVAEVLRCSPKDDDFLLQEKIIEVNPLLEAFGNAKTIMNDNSSRFGKLIELIFTPEGHVAGATITEHMLEKSRVTRQGQSENNFHIFYQMMTGLTVPERKRYFLDEPEKYRILDPGHGAPVFSSPAEFQDYVGAMDNFRRIMPMIGFTEKDMDVVFALLSAILHLCNIELAPDPESDEVIVMNEDEIDFASVLLSVPPEDMVSCLLANVTWVRGERIVMIKTMNGACEGRDALAKALYSKLFSWIVQQINFMLHEEENRQQPGSNSVISILDMAGFENFPSNSFEQLCINAANERLQHFFNEHIFHLELQEYVLEGLKQPKIKFYNNVEILNVFFQRPMSLFSLLEEECRLAKATDLTFVEKLNKQFNKHRSYLASKQRVPVFSIIHYAGEVVYRVQGILDKNRDTLSSNMQSMMENSKNNLVNELFTATVLDTGTLEMRQGSSRNKWGQPVWQEPEKRKYNPGDSLSRQMGRKLRQKMKDPRAHPEIGFTSNVNSASAHFKNSLHVLMEKLSTAEPQFIRCIKPNHRKAPNMFDHKCVQDQLTSTGVMETIRIRQLGYPTRLPFHVFFERYRFISFPLTFHIEPTPARCVHILKTAKLQDWQIGNSKVFLKYWHTDQLNTILDRMMCKLAYIQAKIRTFLTRKSFLYQCQCTHLTDMEVDRFSNGLTHRGDTVYYMLRNQNDHDSSRESQMRRPLSGHPMDNPDYPAVMDKGFGNGAMNDAFSPNGNRQNVNYTSAEIFYRDAVNQVLDKLEADEIDPDVWCKILYMEYNKPVAKFYICEREVIIDSSYDEFDGHKIGLGVFRNPERDERTEKIRSYIGKGLTLRKETDGSILATKLGKNEVIIKGYEDPANHCLSAEVIKELGHLPLGETVKVYDIEQFKSHIGIDLRSPEPNRDFLQQQSILGISFIKDEDSDDLDTACWLCVINIAALDALDSPEVRRQVQQRFAALSIRNEADVENKIALQKVVGRHDRKWSKLTARQNQMKKEPLSKTRLQIKQRGQNVGDRMEYSWNEEIEPKLNIAELQEEMDAFDGDESVFLPHSSGFLRRGNSMMDSSIMGGHLPSSRRDWAKVKLTMKEETKQRGEAIQKSKQQNQY